MKQKTETEIETAVSSESGAVGAVEFVYIESPYLETPNTQRIVFAFDSVSDDVDSVTITVEDKYGNREEWQYTKQKDGLFLFEKNYNGEAYTGTYNVVSINIGVYGRVEVLNLEDMDIEAQFGVNEEYDGYEELQPLDEETSKESEELGATVVTIDENGITEAQDSIADALNVVSAETASVSPLARTASNASSRSGNIVVALDPGHDSRSTGASGNGLREEELTLKIANYCKEELEQYAGVEVYMTRTGADCPFQMSGAGCIQYRVEDAVKAGAQIFVSFHLNSSTSSSASGAEIIVQNNNWRPGVAAESQALAREILDELVALGLNERDIYWRNSESGSTYSDGSSADYFSVQRNCKLHNIPGIIIEHAFISNSGDANSFLKSETGLKSLGVADATGIARYLGLLKGDWVEENGKWIWVWKDGTESPKNQWLNVSGAWYWLDENGYRTSGWKTINSQRYYFDSDGKMAIGWRNLNNIWYYFLESGRAAVGWEYIGAWWYWFADDGEMLTGWQEIGGRTYYFSESGRMATGWQEIGGETYYFFESGRMATGTVTITGEIYEFAEDGTLVGKITPGWLQTGTTWYYIKEDGSKAVGWEYIGAWWYWFADDGEMLTGWQEIWGQTYYFSESGRMATGWQEIGGKTYYFLDAGRMVRGTVIIEGETYEFAEDGTLVGKITPGWLQTGTTWYYIKEDGSKAVGWEYIGAWWYWFADDGEMLTGWQEIWGQTYYFSESGRMATGWQEIGGKTYYFLDAGRMVRGTVIIEGETYEFAEDGTLVGKITPGWLQTGTTWYYIKEDGSKAVGWEYIGAWWYWFADDGEMLTGWQEIWGQTYYFSESGRMATGWQEIGGKTYYFLDAGRMVRGTVIIEGETYEFAEDGTLVGKITPGWLQTGTTWYYIKEDGSKAVGWEYIGAWWYWFADDGEMLTGWQEIWGQTYYFSESGRMATGWQKIGGKTYYFLDAGRMVRGTVIIEGETYEFTEDGTLVGKITPGWLQTGTTWYYIKEDGSKAVGWEYIGAWWYWFADDGEMLTGWQEIGGQTYYFSESGRMATGWQEIEGELNYFDENGHFIHNGVTTIAGKSETTKEEMITFYKNSGHTYPSEILGNGGAESLDVFVQLYIDEAEAEGIRADIAFAQAMLETGYLQYGGDVSIEQFNFAGLGATGNGVKGESFPDVRTGIRAHIQHLKAYANSESLKNTCVDTRFGYVKRASAPYVEWLGISENPNKLGWASSRNYGFTILSILERM